MNFAEKLHLVGSQQKVDETASWNWQQTVEKMRGTGDAKLLTHYCLRLTKIERPPPEASQEVMGTVAICMLAYVEDADLVIAACNLWSHLCEGYDRDANARKHGIASVGAIEAILDGMKHHNSNREVLLAGLRALSNACRGWNEYADWQKQQASDFGAFEVCLPAIRTFAADTAVLHSALMAIVNVASGSGSSATRRKRRAISTGVIGAVAEVLDLHMANASVAHDCIVALGTIYSIEHSNLEDTPQSIKGAAAWKKLSNKFSAADLDKSKVAVIHSVLKCVQAHPRDDALQMSAQRTIGFLMKRS